MDEDAKQKLIQENKKLKAENARLKAILEERELIKTNELLKKENLDLKNSLNNEININEDAEIISLINRSPKRLKILESLENEDKIPKVISEDISDNSYNISKYLKTLKENDLIQCHNEQDKKYRYYGITPKGKKYLDLIKNNE